jgi:asparagine synthase (glutamine-hydrolysing)
MCGITGIYHYANEQPVSEPVLRRMAEVIAHRGPDDDGFFVAGKVGLGHRRLSIIDVAGGHQPIFNEDGTVAIVFNYKELAKLVVARGHTLRTHSDTETIVHLYEEFGEECVALLHGMFAFALWDARNHSMLLARDRLGKKPLYYADVKVAFAFGSELKCLLQNPLVPRVLNEQALSDYFTYQYVPAPKTIYQDVRKLRAGHYLVVTPLGLRAQQYWDLDFSHTEERSEEEWCDELLDTLRNAVHDRLMSEVPLGAFLSGGVDSSAVVKLMSELTARPVVTASIGFTEEKYSEAVDARAFAESLHAEHHERIVNPRAVEIIEKLAWHYDEPFADASAVPTFYVSQAAREFVTVALSGDGGDESFAGYRRYAFDAMENRVRAFAPAVLRKPLFGTLATVYPKADWLPQPLRAKSTLRNLALDPAAGYFMSVYGALANERATLLGGAVLGQLNGYNSFDVFQEHYQRANTDDPLSRAQYVDIKTYLTDDILVKVDRASMAVSLEVRCPLLDHRVLELAARMPSSLKLKGRAGKYIFKRAVSHILPNEILTHRKQGFVLPVAEWLRGELRPLAESLLFEASRQDDLLNPQHIQYLWRQHQSKLRDYTRPLWTVLMFRLWQKTIAECRVPIADL